MSKQYDVTMSEATYRMFAECGKRMQCPDATDLVAMAVEALAEKINMETVVQSNKKFIDRANQWLLHPSDFEGSNAVFDPSPDAGPDEQYALCAAKIDWDGIQAVLTCWKPTRDHLRSIEKTGRIWITQLGSQPNPVAVSAKNPLRFQGIELR